MANARGLALHALVAFERGRTDRVREELDSRSRGVDGRELAFAYELAHGVLRRERLLDFVLTGFAHRGLPKDPQLLCALRLGAYQLLCVPGMPQHAAVHETVGAVRSNRGFANAMLRRLAGTLESRDADAAAAADADAGPDAETGESPTCRSELIVVGNRVLPLKQPLPDDDVARLAIVYSLPDWLAQRVHQEHGVTGLHAVGKAAIAMPPIWLRACGDTDRAALRERLKQEDVHCEPGDHPRMLRWSGGQTPFQTAAFAEGAFVVQDPTALAAVESVACKPGERVLDLCAAPGTKTTWLAEQVRPGGTVLAFDPDVARRGRITENVARLRLEDTVELIDDPEAAASDGSDGANAGAPIDHVLVDVPCSNTGVLGRRVEVRLRLSSGTFEELSVLQRELLALALRRVRPGGTVVYSTCSIDRAENRDVVDAVLASADVAATLQHDRTTLPAVGRHDGGYVAVLRRSDEGLEQGEGDAVPS
ncbi:MAG: RsmB/NOP family class I SAM-dependent RNA methyltransferase [Planctomycetota bacterium]